MLNLGLGLPNFSKPLLRNRGHYSNWEIRQIEKLKLNQIAASCCYAAVKSMFEPALVHTYKTHTQCCKKTRNFEVIKTLAPLMVRSVRLVAGNLGFHSRSGHTKYLQVVFAASRQALSTSRSAKG